MIRALDQVIYINMDVDDYIANYDDSETKRHNSGDKKCLMSQWAMFCVVMFEQIASEISCLKVVFVWLYIHIVI